MKPLPENRWLLMRAFVALLTTRTALGVFRLARKNMPIRAAQRIAALTMRSLPAPMPIASPEQIARAMQVAGRLMHGFDNCLVQAIAAEAILNMAGYPCELRIGVTRRSGEFLAHAWIEIQGEVLVGKFEPGFFTPLSAPPQQGARAMASQDRSVRAGQGRRAST
jgi:hypothetical protein